LYTHSYVNTQKAILAGILEASIKPLRFSQFIKEYGLDSGMVFGMNKMLKIYEYNFFLNRIIFLDIFDELVKSGQIKGQLFGGRQEMSAVFVPDIYTQAQQKYVESFFKQNGYIGELFYE
jgi:hypothetical protein